MSKVLVAMSGGVDSSVTLLKIIEMGHAKNIELRYNSNGIEWQSNLFDLWKEFKNVIMFRILQLTIVGPIYLFFYIRFI